MKELGINQNEGKPSVYRLAVKSPARLHMGLMEICPGNPNLYGGCGIALDEPATVVSVDVSSQSGGDGHEWQMADVGQWHDRIKSVLERARQKLAEMDRPSRNSREGMVSIHRLHVEHPPIAHAGLGSGTQLASCVATLVAASHCDLQQYESLNLAASDIWMFAESESKSSLLTRLAETSGRGARSFVGLASHLFGGFVVDYGVPELMETNRRVDLLRAPEPWHVVLVRPVSLPTISGRRESDYFLRCEIPNPNRHWMLSLIEDELKPAIRAQDLSRFGDAVYRYGRYGGELFRAVQGGVYRDAAVEDLVNAIRKFGVSATGQTSWGPTVYAIVADQHHASTLAQFLREKYADRITTMISRTTNQPATISVRRL